MLQQEQGVTRLFRIKHLADVIGFCFAKTEAGAIAAFRKAHKIPEEIRLTAHAR